MPHKEMALKLTEPDERARKVGVANTVWLRDGKLKSTNTDVEGFIGALDSCAPGWDKRTSTAVVLGAGGAGRAVVFGLIERGIETIHVVNRTYEKAVDFVDRFGPSVKPAHWADIPNLLPKADLLVNSTPLGMKGQPPLDIDLSHMKPGSVVSDIIYVPLQDRAAEGSRGARLPDVERPRHAAASGGSRLHRVVRRQARGDERAARHAGRRSGRLKSGLTLKLAIHHARLPHSDFRVPTGR